MAPVVTWPYSLPRVVWVWTGPPQAGGKLSQIWVDAEGHPLGVDVDLSDLEQPDPLPAASEVVHQRCVTPNLDEVALDDLLAQCRK